MRGLWGLWALRKQIQGSKGSGVEGHTTLASCQEERQAMRREVAWARWQHIWHMLNRRISEAVVYMPFALFSLLKLCPMTGMKVSSPSNHEYLPVGLRMLQSGNMARYKKMGLSLSISDSGGGSFRGGSAAGVCWSPSQAGPGVGNPPRKPWRLQWKVVPRCSHSSGAERASAPARGLSWQDEGALNWDSLPSRLGGSRGASRAGYPCKKYRVKNRASMRTCSSQTWLQSHEPL